MGEFLSHSKILHCTEKTLVARMAFVPFIEISEGPIHYAPDGSAFAENLVDFVLFGEEVAIKCSTCPYPSGCTLVYSHEAK